MENQRAPDGSPGERRYHHGNLRAALIEAGLQLIGEKGVRALTLREIGARVGVSRMAAYRHFANEDDLLDAICEAGFQQFADALEEARNQAHGTFAARLSAMALAYVRFAAEHPAHYEVMFGFRGSGEDRKRTPAAPSAARSFQILEETIRGGQEAGEFREGNTTDLARMVWAEVHGISLLELAPDLRPEGAGTKFVEFCSDVLRTGLIRRDPHRHR